MAATNRALAERQKKIADGLNAANKAQDDLKLLKRSSCSRTQSSQRSTAQLLNRPNRRAGPVG